MKKYFGDAISVAVFVLISVLYFMVPLRDGLVLGGHDHTGGVGAGAEMEQYRREHHGERTRWTNTLFSGMPTYQMAPSYDSTDTLATVKKVYMLGLPDVAAWVFILLLGFYIMMRCFDFRWWMASLGAVLWAFSSYYFIIIGAGHIWKVLTLAFIPPTIGGMALCYKGHYGWGVVVTALFMGLQILSNHVQMSYYFGFVMAAIAVASLLTALQKKEGRGAALTAWVKGTLCFAVGCVLGVAMNISNIYHTWEYSKESMRSKSELTQKTKNPTDQTSSGLERSYITMWSYGIGETWTLLIPNTKGGASVPLSRSETAMKNAKQEYNPIYQQLGQYWGEQPGTSGPVYVGAFVCMLFIVGLLIVKGPMPWCLLVVTMLSIALSWGRNMMGFTDFFLDYFPMYDKFRTVASILVIAEFTIPMLALLGLRALFEHGERREMFDVKPEKALWIAFGLTAGVCALFYALPDLFFGRYVSEQEYAGIMSLAQHGWPSADIIENLNDMRRAVFRADCLRSLGVIVAGTVLLWLTMKGKLQEKWGVLLIVALCLADMWAVNKRYLNDGMFQRKYNAAALFPKTTGDEMIMEDEGLYDRTLDLTCSTFNSNDASYWHKSIGGYHAAKLRRYQEVIEEYLHGEIAALQREVPATGGNLGEVNGDSIFPVLNMLNMRYILWPAAEGDKIALKNPWAMGNAWYVKELRRVDGADEELASLSSINLHDVAVSQTEEGKGGEGTCILVGYEANRLRYEAESNEDGIIVFSEIYYPGWTATVDGKETEVMRVNYILRAIRIPAGRHEVTLTFDPRTVKVTEAVAYGALAVLIIILIAMTGRAVWRRRRS